MSQSQSSTSFKRLSDIEHVLLRSTMYVGSCITTPSTQWTLDPAHLKAIRKTMDYNPGLDQLMNETATNAYDNIPRSRNKGVAPGVIDIVVDRRVVTVYNEGLGIPVEMHPTEKVFTPELIFFNLRTSSNYDDSADRTWAGLNGIGVTLVAILSDWMMIEIADPVRHLLYKQRCDKNLSRLSPPVITPYTGTKAYTKVSYEADFDRFGVKEYSDDMINVCAFNAASASFNTKVPITFNGVCFGFDSIEKFARLFADKVENFILFKDEHVELCLMDTPENSFQLGYVNTLLCKRGGVHVNDTLKLFTTTVLEKLNKKKQLFDVRDVKKHLSLIISCTVVNPVFNGQTKDELVKPTPKINIPQAMIKKVEKWSFVKQMALYSDLKGQSSKEKKTKAVHITDVPEYECANLAGKAESAKCTLILTEGLSAKTFALYYRDCFPNGADYFGVLPMRGKGVNVRNASAFQMSNNKELKAIRKIVGIKPGVDYADPEKRKELRYGRVMYATDADTDGDHISGLGINLFGFSYKSLTQIGFIWGLLTPILKAEKGKTERFFLTKAEYHAWYDSLEVSEQNKWTIALKKGLGGWDEVDFKDHHKFVQVRYKFDEMAEDSLKLAFDATYADARKDWVSNITPPTPTYLPIEDGGVEQEVTDFIHTRLILFSQDDNERSIPSMVDNNKPSQRQIFYSSRKKKLADKPIKIAQFMGYTAEQTHYEHGEENLGSTIMNMCQDFPGANNIPLLTGKGNYGTRVKNGADSADPRYVFMCKSPLTDFLFRKEDDVLLEYLVGDGESIEPKYYYPILPMTIINGEEGIGTGFSSKCPPHNPLDVLAWVRAWICNHYPEGEEVADSFEYPVMIPWYRGFTGTVKAVKPGKFQTEGVMTVDGDVVRITELPINVSISDYSAFVDQLLTDKKIRDKKKSSAPGRVDFTLVGFEKPTLASLKLTSSICTTNLVLFNEEGYLVRYNNVESIMEDFCQHRYDAYERRKKLQLDELEVELQAEKLKISFLEDVLNDRLAIQKNPLVKEQMTEKGYPHTFLKMSLDSIAWDGLARHQEMARKVEVKIEEVRQRSARNVWESELGDFSKAYGKVYSKLKIGRK